MCINGQLMLLDLIEHLEVVPGFELIQHIPNLKKMQRREVLDYMELIVDEKEQSDAVFLLNLFKLFSLFLNKFFNLLFTFRGETASDKFQQFPDLGNAADIQKFFKMNSH